MIKKIFFLAFILLCFNIFSNADYSTSNDEANISASDQNFNNLDIGSVFLIIIAGAILFEYFGSNSSSNENYNVFIIMDNRATKNIKNISKKLEENEIENLYTQGYVIHVTLYLTKYEKNSLYKIKETVEKIASQTKSFDMEFYKLEKTERKTLAVYAKNNQNIQQLADEITVNLTKYRKKDIKTPEWVRYFPEKEKLFNLYGSPDVFINFNPHVTLLTQENSSKINSFISNYTFTPFKTKAISIGIGKANNLGHTKEIIYSQSLTG